MRIREFGIALAALIALQGCGDGGGDTPVSVAPTVLLPVAQNSTPLAPDDGSGAGPVAPPLAGRAVPDAFVGTWQTDCIAVDGFGARQLVFLEQDLRETGSIVYFETDCVTPQIETRAGATITFGDALVLADSSPVVEVDLVLSGEVRTIPLNATTAAGLSAERACGITDWQANVDYDTSDCALVADPIRPLVGLTARQIYSVQGEALFIGRFFSTPVERVPATRPTTLDFTNPYRRVVR